jgi:hypothetical protein
MHLHLHGCLRAVCTTMETNMWKLSNHSKSDQRPALESFVSDCVHATSLHHTDGSLSKERSNKAFQLSM